MTRTHEDYPKLKEKIDDLYESLKIRNVSWNDKDRKFIAQMKTAIHFTPAQIAYVNGLWEKL